MENNKCIDCGCNKSTIFITSNRCDICIHIHLHHGTLIQYNCRHCPYKTVVHPHFPKPWHNEHGEMYRII